MASSFKHPKMLPGQVSPGHPPSFQTRANSISTLAMVLRALVLQRAVFPRVHLSTLEAAHWSQGQLRVPPHQLNGYSIPVHSSTTTARHGSISADNIRPMHESSCSTQT